MTLSGFQGLVFDLDGTLVDSMPLHLAAWEHTAREFGFRFDADWFYELGGMPSRKIALLVAEVQQIALDPLVVTRCKTEHYVANLHKATPFPAMLDLVASSKSASKRDVSATFVSRDKASMGWLAAFFFSECASWRDK